MAICSPTLYGRGLLCPFAGGKRTRETVPMAKVIECAQAHYEIQDLEFGKVCKWRSERILAECECGENQTLSASKHACEECGADHRPLVEEVLESHLGENKEWFDHPWRSLRPYYTPTRGT
jgi:hypothetical protein